MVFSGFMGLGFGGPRSGLRHASASHLELERAEGFKLWLADIITHPNQG